ncbi:LytTR family DNA-binding domain-containing protein [uncultured Ramlibacter sp.]|uniref:LytR/AlgR family response regulator transcription factor n=1 Tax=uncultured Ramlibacter sp. TaxID=260755 RepID=UPI0026070915|nr:LytTR family DNA-binding domain-containing protein [uncultured Ramlibacter sp.]
MPTALIADDEPFMRAALRDQLAALWPELQIVSEAEDGPGALRAIEALQPDIAFLDIQMPGLTGLQVAQSISTRSCVVFVTAHDAHALEAFEANAVDYVLKPLDTVRVAKLVTKLQRSLETMPAVSLAQVMAALQREQPPAQASGPEWLQVGQGTQVRMVHVDDVMFFKSDNKYTRVVAGDCDGVIRLSLKDLLDGLDGRVFVQISRSAVVNRRFIRAVRRVDDAMELEIKGQSEKLPVSAPNHHLFRAM